MALQGEIAGVLWRGQRRPGLASAVAQELGGPGRPLGGPDCRPHHHESEDSFSCSRPEKAEPHPGSQEAGQGRASGEMRGEPGRKM